MYAFDGLKRCPARPSSEGTGAVRMDCVLSMQGAHQRVQEPLHACLRPRGTTTRDTARLAEHRRDLRTAKSRL